MIKFNSLIIIESLKTVSNHGNIIHHGNIHDLKFGNIKILLMLQKSGEKTSWYGSLSHYFPGFQEHPRWLGMGFLKDQQKDLKMDRWKMNEVSFWWPIFRGELLVFREGRKLSQFSEKWCLIHLPLGYHCTFEKSLKTTTWQNIEMLDRSEFDRSAECSSIG